MCPFLTEVITHSRADVSVKQTPLPHPADGGSTEQSGFTNALYADESAVYITSVFLSFGKHVLNSHSDQSSSTEHKKNIKL